MVIPERPVIIPEIRVPRPQFFITEERIKKTGASRFAYENPNISSEHIPATEFSDLFLEIHRRRGDEISPEENTIDRILYLSCLKTKPYFGEYIIHKALEDAGHTVIFPEEHSWETVISMVRKHTRIAGLRGSAMHFLMFCRQKKRVTYFDTKPRLQHNFHNLEQMMENESEYVQLQADGLPHAPSTRTLLRYSEIVRLLHTLGVDSISEQLKIIYHQFIVPDHRAFWTRQLKIPRQNTGHT